MRKAENFVRNVPHFTRCSFSGFRIPHSAEDGVYMGRWLLICTHTAYWKMRQWCTRERTGHSPSYAEAKKMTYTHLHTHIYKHLQTHTYTHIYMYIYICMYIHVYISTYMYILYICILLYICISLANSAMMSTPTAHCQLEDETVVHEGEDWPLAPNL